MLQWCVKVMPGIASFLLLVTNYTHTSCQALPVTLTPQLIRFDCALTTYIIRGVQLLMPPAGSTLDMQPVLQCLQKYGFAVLPASFLQVATLEAMHCEAAALLEQAEAEHCHDIDLEDMQQLAEQR
jgi:hypothetical protein